MVSQTESPPSWGTLNYWEWIKERYLSDDPREFGAVMSNEAESGRAYVLARRSGLQDADAREVAQEYCLGIFKARVTYDPTQPINAFLNTILYRAILAYRRRLVRNAKVVLLPFQADEDGDFPVFVRVPSPSGTPLDEVISVDEMSRIRECIGKLRSTDAEALTLRYIEEFTVEQIARLLGITEATVHTRLSRARSRLQVLLTQSEAQ